MVKFFSVFSAMYIAYTYNTYLKDLRLRQKVLRLYYSECIRNAVKLFI